MWLLNLLFRYAVIAIVVAVIAVVVVGLVIF